MSIFAPQNPGISGLNELTEAEELTVQAIAALGTPGQFLRTNLAGTAVEWTTSGSGVTTFLALTDTPSAYTGQSLKVVRVNAGETALEFATVSGTGDVVGPASAVNNRIATFDGITGKLVKDSGSLVGDFATAAQGTLANTAVQPAALSSYELLANKATDFTTVNDTKYPTVEAVTEYVASAVVGLLDYRGTYNASTNLYPATGGSGLAGAILKGDFYIVSVAGTLGGTTVTAGDLVIALIDTPAQTAANWDIISNEVGYTPENAANKVTSISGASTDVQYPSAKLLYDQLVLKAALASPTFTGTVTTPAIVVSSETASTLASFDASKNVKSLATASYPSLTEIAYVKGVTSAIQTQLNAKASLTGTETLTNKRVTKRIGSTTSSATPTINTDNVDAYHLTAQTADITSFTTNLSGTPTDFQTLAISVTGTAARAITWGASFENGPVALPTTTVTTTRLDVFFMWNAVTSKWRCMATGSTV